MNFYPASLEGLIIIEPDIYPDDRGYFFESYNKSAFGKNGIPVDYVQDNQSSSNKGVLRGLHFQQPPFEQGKLVRVSKGAVLDVCVDIRNTSPSYGKSFFIELNDRNHRMLWIPPGFAHGFLTLDDQTVFLYKCTGFYNKEAESGIRFNDPALKIQWGEKNPVLSSKDLQLPFLKDIKYLG